MIRFWRQEPADEPPTPGRPANTKGDTGLRYTGWMAAAHQSLVFSTRDDDPRCMKVLATEAIAAADLARATAKNERQKVAAQFLREAADEIYQIALDIPDLSAPHTHDPKEM